MGGRHEPIPVIPVIAGPTECLFSLGTVFSLVGNRLLKLLKSLGFMTEIDLAWISYLLVFYFRKGCFIAFVWDFRLTWEERREDREEELRFDIFDQESRREIELLDSQNLNIWSREYEAFWELIRTQICLFCLVIYSSLFLRLLQPVVRMLSRLDMRNWPLRPGSLDLEREGSGGGATELALRSCLRRRWEQGLFIFVLFLLLQQEQEALYNKYRIKQHMHEYNQLNCPKCRQTFPPAYGLAQFMEHVQGCTSNPKKEQAEDFVYQKIPIDSTKTKYRWEKKPKMQPSQDLYNKDVHEVSQLSFQQKEMWLRNRLEGLRIPWTAGADFMRIDKNNILMGSLVESKKVNMHKEVKIEFLGEKVNDAGGLLREWIHMVIKQLFDFSTGLFTIANTDDIMYRLNWDEDVDEYFSEPLLTLFGIILAKSIFERTPLTCYLDRTILRQLCNGTVQMQDIYGYDCQLYKNWEYLANSEDVEEMQTYFVTYKNKGGNIHEIELLEGHRQIKVTNENKLLYIDLCMEMHTTIKVSRSIRHIKAGIEQVFPTEWLSVLEPCQLEMLLYGVPFIDLQDWHDNTEYKNPYNASHPMIKWFWDLMQEFDQEQLSRVLHFCTGSSRTPIHGFKKLESNRGNYSKFLIVPVAFDKKNPYPKGHTCFNRLELPQYPNLPTFKTYLTAIAANNLDGIFGLD